MEGGFHGFMLWMVAESISQHRRNPGMIRFLCKYQPTAVFPWLPSGADVRPSTVRVYMGLHGGSHEKNMWRCLSRSEGYPFLSGKTTIWGGVNKNDIFMWVLSGWFKPGQQGKPKMFFGGGGAPRRDAHLGAPICC